jgi:16S rRNA G527 N7-methylase RsmG
MRAVALGRPSPAGQREALRESWTAARLADGRFDAAALRDHEEWRELEPLIARTGADPDYVLPKLAQLAALILTWNRTVSNLISRGDEARLVSRHMRECIEPIAWIATTARAEPDAGSTGDEEGALSAVRQSRTEQGELKTWLDLGSGAGFPALIIALCGIGKEWSLVEARRPKVLFLRRAIAELGLSGVRVIHSRLELMVPGSTEHRDDDVTELLERTFDGFTSRATMTLAPTLELAAQVVRHGGSAYLWKGSGRENELRDHGRWANDWGFEGETILDDGPVAVCRFLRTS